MKNLLFLFVVLLLAIATEAQMGPTDSSFFIKLNQQTDDAVVRSDTALLKKLYADDFFFSHGTGNKDNKTSWLEAVAKGGFISRQHDSVTVELHKEIAIVRGKLNVEKKTPTGIDKYFVKYVRVYSPGKKHWQMISHFTFLEEHEP